MIYQNTSIMVENNSNFRIGRYAYVILAFFSLLISCKESRKEYDPIDLFSSKKELIGEEVQIPNLHIGNPGDAISMDSLLIISDMADEKFLHIIDIKNKKSIGKFGRRGRGPGELITPSSLQRVDEKNISLYDPNLKKLFIYNIDSLIEEEDYLPHEMIDFKDKGYKNTKVYLLNGSSLFLSIGLFDDGRYALFDSDGGLIQKKFSFPDDNLKMESEHLPWVYQGNIVIKASYDKFVFNTFDGGILEICEIKNNDLIKIKDIHAFFPRYSASSGEVRMDKDNKRGFIHTSTGENKIFALYSGKSFEEYGRSFFPGENILSFDWNGTPLTHYVTENSLKLITFNEMTGELFGIEMEVEPRILKFKLK